MTHEQITAREGQREYDHRGHILRRIDIDQIAQPHFWDHLPAAGYCLDALDKIPAGGMQRWYGFAAQQTTSR